MGSDNVEYNVYEMFPINKTVMDFKISMDDVDAILDRFLENEDTEADNEKIIEYVVQFFYINGIRETSISMIHEKMQNLLQERTFSKMEKLGLIEFSIDSNGVMSVEPVNKENKNESDL